MIRFYSLVFEGGNSDSQSESIFQTKSLLTVASERRKYRFSLFGLYWCD
jgi:hypothetical protein